MKSRSNIALFLYLALAVLAAGMAMSVARGGHLAQDAHTLYFVDNLADSGSGTLRECVDASGARTCIFQAGGIIEMESDLTVKNGSLRIAGQTAPGGGITLDGGGKYSLAVEGANDVLVEYITIRDSEDGIQATRGASNVTYRHVSSSWARDENASTYKASDNIVFEYLLSAEGISGHSKGILLYDSASVLYSYFTSNEERNIRCQGGKVTFAYSVVHNSQRGTWCDDKHGDVQIDIVGNTFSVGPDTDTGRAEIKLDPNVIAYIADNVGYDGDVDVELGGGEIADSAFGTVAESRMADDVLAIVGNARGLGCDGTWYMRRDEVDARLVQEYHSKTGSIPDSPYRIPDISSGTACADSDEDGIPDLYESVVGGTLDDYLSGSDVQSPTPHPSQTPEPTSTKAPTPTTAPTSTPISDDDVLEALQRIELKLDDLSDHLGAGE